jgi:hypothetical protein
MILGADIEVRQTIGNVEQTAEFSQNYFAFEMSIRFGGRKRAPAMILVPAGPPPGYAPPPAPMPPPPPAPMPEPMPAPAPEPAPVPVEPPST